MLILDCSGKTIQLMLDSSVNDPMLISSHAILERPRGSSVPQFPRVLFLGGSLLRTLAAAVSHPEPHRAFLGIATGHGDHGEMGRGRMGWVLKMFYHGLFYCMDQCGKHNVC